MATAMKNGSAVGDQRDEGDRQKRRAVARKFRDLLAKQRQDARRDDHDASSPAESSLYEREIDLFERAIVGAHGEDRCAGKDERPDDCRRAGVHVFDGERQYVVARRLDVDRTRAAAAPANGAASPASVILTRVPNSR